MGIHIAAKKGEIAPTVILPGDPLRARHIAKNFLNKAKLYNEVRNMYGFTGYYKGKRVSVQGTGMGMPSMTIYAHELIENHGAKKLIRVGSCGSMQRHVQLGDLVLAMSASTDSGMNLRRFNGKSFAPTADFSLLCQAHEQAGELGLEAHVGPVLCSDFFYSEDRLWWKEWAQYSIMAVEMETAALYTLAQRFSIPALAILSVTDYLPTMKALSSKARESQLNDMIELALSTIVED